MSIFHVEPEIWTPGSHVLSLWVVGRRPPSIGEQAEAGLPCSIRSMALSISRGNVWSLARLGTVSLVVAEGGRRLLESYRADGGWESPHTD